MLSQHPKARFQFRTNLALGWLTLGDICHSCDCYRKPLTIYLRHEEDTIDLQLVFTSGYTRPISAAGHTLQWFCQRQQLGAVFGRNDPTMYSGSSKCSCLSTDNPRKRKIGCLLRSSKRRRQNGSDTLEHTNSASMFSTVGTLHTHNLFMPGG